MLAVDRTSHLTSLEVGVKLNLARGVVGSSNDLYNLLNDV